MIVELVSTNADHVGAGHVIALEVGTGRRAAGGRTGDLAADPADVTAGETFDVSRFGFPSGSPVMVVDLSAAIDPVTAMADTSGTVHRNHHRPR